MPPPPEDQNFSILLDAEFHMDLKHTFFSPLEKKKKEKCNLPFDLLLAVFIHLFSKLLDVIYVVIFYFNFKS